MRNSLCAEFSAPFFFVRRHSAGWGVEKKGRATSSRRDFQEVVAEQLQTGGDGQVNMNGREARPHFNCSSAPRRIHNLRLSRPPPSYFISLKHAKVSLLL